MTGTDPAGWLTEAGLDPAAVHRVVRTALEEDLRPVDVTSVATIPADARGTADLVARAPGVVAGLPVAAAVLHAVAGDRAAVEPRTADGTEVAAGDVLATVTGPVRELLTAERTMLNLLTHLSGIATLTHRFVAEVAGTGAVVRDSRKTLPGLRALQKYAVRCGGGANHRMSLSDAALIKDNHVVEAGGVAAAFRAVRAAYPGVPIEVECDTVEQVAAAVEAGADEVLLDNMDAGRLAAAVAVTAGRARLEASGGLTLDTVRAAAATGVDYLAIGALTHSAGALDIGMDLR